MFIFTWKPQQEGKRKIRSDMKMCRMCKSNMFTNGVNFKRSWKWNTAGLWAASISIRIGRMKQKKLLSRVKMVIWPSIIGHILAISLSSAYTVIRRFLMDQSMLSLDNKVDSKTKGVCIRLFSFIWLVFRVDSSL